MAKGIFEKENFFLIKRERERERRKRGKRKTRKRKTKGKGEVLHTFLHCQEVTMLKVAAVNLQP